MTDDYLNAVALGFYALDAPVLSNPADGWPNLDERRRELYRAKARFVLSYADPTALAAGRTQEPAR
jgi:hypothetical protein